MLRAAARVNLAAVERNIGRLRARLAPSTDLCAVVKADGYGHGAAPVARAALNAGAGWLAVATAQEALELRSDGIDARLLVMGAISAAELPVALAAQADLVAWDERFVEALRRAADRRIRIHVKLDTGMGRLGDRDADTVVRVAELVSAAPELELVGAMTHFATADGDQEFLSAQLGRFRPFVDRLRREHPQIVVHAANSAATLRAPESHFDLVRTGIAIYGGDPMNSDPAAHGLEPALELSSYVAAVKSAQPGDSAGYGRTFIAERETLIGTVPIGYGDGVRRGLGNNCEVLVGGRRCPIVGTVSMDNITVDLGDRPVEVGTPVILIGSAGSERVTLEEIAGRLGTINYEVACGISPRVPRHHHRDGEPIGD